MPTRYFFVSAGNIAARLAAIDSAAGYPRPPRDFNGRVLRGKLGGTQTAGRDALNTALPAPQGQRVLAVEVDGVPNDAIRGLTAVPQEALDAAAGASPEVKSPPRREARGLAR